MSPRPATGPAPVAVPAWVAHSVLDPLWCRLAAALVAAGRWDFTTRRDLEVFLQAVSRLQATPAHSPLRPLIQRNVDGWAVKLGFCTGLEGRFLEPDLEVSP